MKSVNLASSYALLVGCSMACNLYDAAYPDQVFLCADQTCTIEGDQSKQCQSGCCESGKCDNDGACAKRQFIYAMVSILCIFIAGLGVYFTYWHFCCKSKI